MQIGIVERQADPQGHVGMGGETDLAAADLGQNGVEQIPSRVAHSGHRLSSGMASTLAPPPATTFAKPGAAGKTLAAKNSALAILVG